MERLLDIVLSSLAILVLFPLLAACTVILKFSGEGEIFFLQERVGKNGKLFKLLKFATMLKNSPNIGTGSITIKGDPRILPAGKFFRKTKINELPQLFNIIRGDMSVIGPRPLTKQTFNSYSDETKAIIKGVRPGLSGVGSIIFRREEEILQGSAASIEFYDNVIAPYKGILEHWFVVNRGLIVYFKAIFITVWTVFVPTTKIAWKVFKDLPEPPKALRKFLNYPE